MRALQLICPIWDGYVLIGGLQPVQSWKSMLQALMWGQRVRNKNVGLHGIVRLTFPIPEQLKPTAESLSILLQQISCWLSVTRTCTLESFRFSEKNVSAHPATYGHLDESSVTPKHTRAEKHVMLVKKPFNYV